MQMGKLPRVMLPDEQECAPLQGQLATVSGGQPVKHECDEPHIPQAFQSEVARLQVQVGRPGPTRRRADSCEVLRRLSLRGSHRLLYQRRSHHQDRQTHHITSPGLQPLWGTHKAKRPWGHEDAPIEPRGASPDILRAGAV